jgi:hypothetical protein
LIEHDLSGKPVPILPDHALKAWPIGCHGHFHDGTDARLRDEPLAPHMRCGGEAKSGTRRNRPISLRM